MFLDELPLNDKGHHTQNVAELCRINEILVVLSFVFSTGYFDQVCLKEWIRCDILTTLTCMHRSAYIAMPDREPDLSCHWTSSKEAAVGTWIKSVFKRDRGKSEHMHSSIPLYRQLRFGSDFGQGFYLLRNLWVYPWVLLNRGISFKNFPLWWCSFACLLKAWRSGRIRSLSLSLETYNTIQQALTSLIWHVISSNLNFVSYKSFSFECSKISQRQDYWN